MESNELQSNELYSNHNAHPYPDRIFSVEYEWFFSTREGINHGPFSSQDDAARELGRFVKLMKAWTKGEYEMMSPNPDE